MSISKNDIVNKRANDPLDQLIFEQGLRIKNVWMDRDLDLIVVLLNNRFSGSVITSFFAARQRLAQS